MKSGQLQKVMKEIVVQSKVEFNYNDEDDEDNGNGDEQEQLSDLL